MRVLGMAVVVVLVAVVGVFGEEGKVVSEAALNGAIQDGRYDEAVSLLDKRISAGEEKE